MKLSPLEQQTVYDTLLSERFVDQAPASIVATLLDEGVYLCSERTMYRLLKSRDQVRERRRIRRHTNYSKPELLATGPGMVMGHYQTKRAC